MSATRRRTNCPKDIPLTLAQGPVAEAILKAAQDFRADLIIMPTAGKRGLLAAFRNSVSARVLDDPRWPVLSVPAQTPLKVRNAVSRSCCPWRR